MTTMQQFYLQRLRSAEQARINKEMRELTEKNRKREEKMKDAMDFFIGVFSGLGLSIMAWIIVWSFFQ